jgi:uncharacterized protein (DUF697 family)
MSHEKRAAAKTDIVSIATATCVRRASMDEMTLQTMDEQADKIIANWSLAALAGNLLPPPFDMAAVSAVFARMGSRLSHVYGVQMRWPVLKNLGKAIGQGIGAVLTASYFGTSMFKYVPGVNIWVALLVQPPMVGAVTYASGHAFKEYYRAMIIEGRSLTSEEVRELAKNAIRERLDALRKSEMRPHVSQRPDLPVSRPKIETRPYEERRMVVLAGGLRRQRQAPGQFLELGPNLPPVRYVAREEVENVSFPVGHPLHGFLYVVHPLVPTQYYLAADFHNRVFAHKVAEVSRMLRNLGASHIKVERVEGYTANATIKAALGAMGEEIKGGAGYNRASGRSIEYEATFRVTAPPRLPTDLVWFDHEDMWKEIAEGRLHHGSETFKLNVEYKDDYGVKANLGRSIEALKIKLELGGDFKQYQATTWHISGEFGDPR